MTEDCQDDGDGDDGSFEDLRAEFEDLVGQFEKRAAEDRAKRADGVAVGLRTEAEPGPATVGLETRSRSRSKQRPFNPQPVLLAPHYEESEQRPIPQRSRLATGGELDIENDWKPNHPLRSESVSVRESPDGRETDVVESGQEYTVECTVRNVGGLAARNANVELFVEHLEPDAWIDVNEETGFFEASVVYEGHTVWNWLYYLSGVTTMAPSSALFAQFHEREESPPVESYLLGVPIDAGNDHEWYDRNFFETAPSESPFVPEGDEFTVDVWDVSRVEGEISKAALDDVGIHLTRQEGRFVDDGPERYWTRDHHLTGDVNQAQEGADGPANRRIDKKSVSIPQNDSRTVTFTYTPDEGNFPRSDLQNPPDLPPGAGRSVTAFYVRTYSLGSNEVPQAFGELNHTRSRFMARTEVKRTL